MNPDSEPENSKVPEIRRKQAARRKKVVRDLDLSTVGMVFPIALLLGYFGGGLLGEWLGAPELGSWIGLSLGLLSGFYNLFKVALVLQKREQETANLEESERYDEDPEARSR